MALISGNKPEMAKKGREKTSPPTKVFIRGQPGERPKGKVSGGLLFSHQQRVFCDPDLSVKELI